ncbi:AMP-binding protein, partial [Peribacillus simplex]|uniref:AMP-binding protein n=1 Tax=Peribacillus simplex TaxID=1478 RepID=UPI003D2D2635
MTEDDRAAKYAGVGFDASVWEIFPYLISGATIYLVPEEIRLDLEALHHFYNEHSITIGFLPTQLCEQFMERDLRSLRVLTTGGDKLNRYQKQSYRLFNNYGPTENTVVATSYEVTDALENLPIGRPIQNVQAYVLDQHHQLQPTGVPGELCLSGESLARGYLNRPDLTVERFIDHPFEEGKRLYKTGDLVKWTPEGNLVFLGRIDEQVQIRGYRVEPGEVSYHFGRIDGIEEAYVLADPEGSYLCGYYRSENELEAKALQDQLKDQLPAYMIPTHFIRVEAFPLTPNGKVDRKQLPKPDLN